eukprot:m.36209 g.36209  ORF g.36209 m.36209 type:complete len:482 (+) comp9647_c0_seq1:92-1537(+)
MNGMSLDSMSASSSFKDEVGSSDHAALVPTGQEVGEKGHKIDWRVFALVVCYGVGAWVTINGLFSELPLIVEKLPEGWATASYLTLVIQIANIGPVIYVLVEKHVSLFSANLAVLLLGAVSMILLAFLWDTTSDVGGERHSVPLLVLSFAAALADCTTSLLFWPFLGRFPSPYAAALSTGEGLSGLLAAALSWIQGAPNDGLLFSPMVFFFLLAAMLLCSLAAFLALYRRTQPANSSIQYAALPIAGGDAESLSGATETDPIKENRKPSLLSKTLALLPRPRAPPSSLMLAGPYLLAVAWLSACQNGIKPSIASYATLPYGSRIYQATSNTALALDPLCALLSLVYPASPRVMASGLLLMTLLMVYVLVIALHSPAPPSMGGAGAPFVLLAMTFGSILQSYLKASALRTLQAIHAIHCPTPTAPKTLTHALSSHPETPIAARLARGGALPTALGVAMQVGSLLAAVTFFCLVNYSHLFSEG